MSVTDKKVELTTASVQLVTYPINSEGATETVVKIFAISGILTMSLPEARGLSRTLDAAVARADCPRSGTEGGEMSDIITAVRAGCERDDCTYPTCRCQESMREFSLADLETTARHAVEAMRVTPLIDPISAPDAITEKEREFIEAWFS